MSRPLSLSAVCAAGALALGVGLSTVPAGAATKSAATHSTSTTTTHRGFRVAAQAHSPRVPTADYTVWVDAPPPSGHNFQYTDYFPRTSLTVHTGAVIDFTWSSNLGPDSFHSATLLATGTTPQADSNANPPVAPDENESPPLATAFNTFAPSPLSGCGDPASPPCDYDGSATISSGATGQGSDFFVHVTAAPASPTTYTFHCRVHPGMHGSFTVVPGAMAASDPAAIGAQVASQWQSDTNGILAAEAAADHGAYVTNPDGTHHVTITAGTGTQYVEALEMLPWNVRVAPGDIVTWHTTSGQEIHTVTFPRGHGSDAVDPFNFSPVCETASPPDGAANLNGPPPTWCPSGMTSDIEFPLDPAPQGATIISTPTTVGSSGIIASFPGSPFPTSYTFTFPSTGVFHYQCRVHDHMVGTIFVSQSPVYWNVASDGGIFAHPPTSFSGSAGNIKLNSPIVGMSPTPDPGYVLAGADGGVFAFGDAAFKGSMGNVRLNQPVVGIAESPDGGGYTMAASDGGIFNFGDAGFHGSLGNLKLNQPVVGIATTPSGEGYWMVAADGGVFAFGDAVYHGGMGGIKINKPMVGMVPTPSGLGYWLVASDGGVFSFGDATFHGSTGNIKLNKPVVGISSDLGGGGYWLVASDGGVFAFGDAPFMGSEGNITLNKPMVGMGSL